MSHKRLSVTRRLGINPQATTLQSGLSRIPITSLRIHSQAAKRNAFTFAVHAAVAVLLVMGLLGLLPKASARASHVGSVDVCTLPGRIINDGDLTYEDNDVIVDGCTNATINGQHTFESLTVRNNGVLRHSATSSSTVHRMDLTISGPIVVEAGSSINAGGRGFLGGSKNGNRTGYTLGNTQSGGSTFKNGGSHAAYGRTSNSGGSVAATYGDPMDPRDPGSGGGADSSCNLGGRPGGGVIILAAQSLTLDGTIASNGTSTSGSCFVGAGAGGSVNIDVSGLFDGSGSLLANGGNAHTSTSGGGGGGGGRIAVSYGTSTFFGTMTTRGGVGYLSRYAGAGTIFTKEFGQAYGDLLVDNGGNSGSSTPFDGGSFDNITAQARGTLVDISGTAVTVTDAVRVDNATLNVQDLEAGSLSLTNGGVLPQPSTSLTPRLIVSGPMSASNTSLEMQTIVADSLDIGPSVSLFHPATNASNVFELDITINGPMTVASGSTVHGNGRGFLGGFKNGNRTGFTLGNTQIGGSTFKNGGSHAGYGRVSNSGGSVAATYGDPTDPRDPGSGGGADSSCGLGGRPGGGVVIVTAQSLTVDGTISANGTNAIGSCFVGAGAGGSVNLSVAGLLDGAGSLSADGGSASTSTSGGGGAGGGRLAVQYGTSTFTGTMSALGRVGYVSRYAGAGTVFTQQSGQVHGALLVDNGGNSGSSTPLDGGDYDSITVQARGAVVETTDAIVNVLDAVVIDNASLDIQQLVADNLTSTNGTLLQADLTTPNLMSIATTMLLDSSALTVQSMEASSLTLQNGTSITHPASPAGGAIVDLQLTVAGPLTIDATSLIDVNSRGFDGGSVGVQGSSAVLSYSSGNTKALGSRYCAGGSHGGRGGNFGSNASGATYDDSNNPLEPGAGGAGCASNSYGGRGGGVVIIGANSLTLEGLIRANGGVKFGGSYRMGGAGGSVNINANSFSGAGTIQANGAAGHSAGQGGGGGRVFMCSPGNSFTGIATANGASVGGGTGTVVTASTGCTAPSGSGDITPPEISNVNSSGDTGDGSLDEGESTTVLITQLLVTLNEDVKDTGDTAPDGVTNPANYNVSGMGGGSIAIDSVMYDSGTFTATLNVNGGASLPPDDYTLTVVGSTSIEDLAGNKLDGNSDGVGGDDFTRNFTVQPATLTVCASGCDYTTIQAAVDAANPGDIVDIAGETFVENVVVPKTLTLQGAGAGNTIVDGNAAGTVFRITGGTVTLAEMTIQNGSASKGGGLVNQSASINGSGLEIKDNNSTGQGGGIYNAGGTLDLTDSILSGNTATGAGGGLRNPDTGIAVLTGVSLTGNHSDYFGGGIFNSGDLTIVDSTLNGNSSVSGGAIFNTKDGSPVVGLLTITGSTISANTSITGGGGITNVYGGQLMMTNSTISGNTTNTTASIRGEGGALLNQNPAAGLISIAELNNVTVTNNYAYAGGGIRTLNASTTIKNTILAGNTATVYGPDCMWDIISDGYNLVGDTTNCAILGDATGNLTNVSAELDVLADNGGTTETHALLTGSPAIDAGNDTTCEATDQRGIARPQDAACDIGAFEGRPPVTPPAGLVSWWPGDANTDDIIGGHDGTLANGAAFGTGLVDQAFSLDGVDDYVGPVGDASTYSFMQNSGVFTIEGWIKLDDHNDGNLHGIIANTATTAEKGFMLLYEDRATSGFDRALRFQLVRGASGSHVVTLNSPNGVITDNGFHHVAATGDGTNVRLYVDGVEVASGAIGTLSTGNATRAANIGRVPSFGHEFDGLIDELTVYNRGLSAAEILDIYNAGSGGKDSDTPLISTVTLAGAEVGTPYSESVSAILGTEPYTFALSSGALPNGLSLSAAGAISGTPTAAGSFNFTVEVTDVDGDMDEQALSIEVTAPVAVIPPAGLVSWWPGEGDATDIADGNDGTLVNGATFAAGKVEQAFDFDGVNDYMVVPDAANLDITQVVTMEAWVKLDNYPSEWSTIVMKGNTSSGRAYGMWVRSTGDILISYYNGAWYHLYPGGQGFTTGAWHHVAGVIDTVNNYRAIYIDGVRVASSSAAIPSMPANGYSLYIGSRTGTWPTNGRIDEATIYNRALTATEIQAVYDAGSAGKDKITPLITTGELDEAVVGEAYAETLATILGTSPYTYGIVAGALPDGLALSAAGEITGTPTVAGDFTFTVQVTDGAGKSSQKALSIRVLTPVAPPAGMVSWWPAEGDATDIADGNDGTLANGATFAAGRVGQAFDFDGVNDYVVVPDAANLDITQAVTMEAWVKLDNYPSLNNTIVMKGNTSSGRAYGMWVRNTGDILISYYNGAWYHLYPGGQGFTTGAWHHVVGVIDTVNNYRAIYIDGVRVASSSAAIPSMPANGYSLYIGSRTGTWPTNGRIDEATIYNRALTATEIQAIYDAGGAGKDKNLADVVPPTIANVNSVVDTGDGSLDEGEMTTFEITQLLVTFSEDVKDTGAAALDGVINPANYSLSSATTGAISIDSVTYDSGTFTATLNINGTAALPPDDYTLTMVGSTSIKDLAGNKLDGNGDGTGGDDFSRAFTVAAPEPVTPPAGLVSWWPGDGDATDIADGNDGTLLNGVTFAAGKVDQAFSFDGVDDLVVVPHASNLNFGTGDFTIEAWIDGDSLADYARIADKQVSGSFNTYRGWALYSDGSPSVRGQLSFTIRANSRLDLRSGVLINDGELHHVVVTRESSVIRMYVDGAFVNSATSPAGSADNTDDLGIGARSDGLLSWSGLIDELAIYHRVLSQAEIQSIYDAGSAGKVKTPPVTIAPPSGLVSWWPGDGDGEDIIGSNDVSAVNGATFGAGMIDEAFRTDGVNDAHEKTSPSNLNIGNQSWTAFAWVAPETKSNPSDGYHKIVGRYESGWGSIDGNDQADWRIFVGNDGLAGMGVRGDNNAASFTVTGTTNILDSGFHLVVGVLDRDAQQIAIYVDGIAEDSMSAAGLSTLTDAGSPLSIGRNFRQTGGNASNNHFNGAIDEVAVFNRALTAAEIQAIFDAGRAGMEKIPPDTTPPTVTNVNSAADTGDGKLRAGEITTAAITQLLVTFDEDVAGTEDVANYSLTGAVAISGVSYDGGTRTATIDLAAALPPDEYTLTVSAQPGVTDLAGNPLDGNSDGTGGDDFTRAFAVSATTPALLVSTAQNATVLRFDGLTGTFVDVFVPILSGGLANTGQVNYGPDGNLYVGSLGSSAVIRYDGLSGEFIDVFASGAGPGVTPLEGPFEGVFGPDGNLYVGDWRTTNRVLRYNGVTGDFLDEFVSHGEGGLVGPVGVAFGPDGNLYVASYGTDSVIRYDLSTSDPIDTFASGGGLDGPMGILFHRDSYLYVLSQSNNSVVRYDATSGDFVDVFVASGSGGLDSPGFMAFGPDGNLYVASFNSKEILRYDSETGDFIDVFAAVASGGVPRTPIGVNFSPPVFDITAPGVSNVDSLASTGGGTLDENEATNAAITQLVVTFDEVMKDSGPVVAHSVANTANYSRDGLTGGAVTIEGAAYDAGTRTVTLDVNGGDPLPTDEYTLTVSGNLVDVVGNALDGGDFVRKFSVDTTPPAFVVQALNYDAGVLTLDNAGEMSEAGSVTVVIKDESDGSVVASDTAPANGSAPFAYSHSLTIPTPAPAIVRVEISIADAVGNVTVGPALLLDTLISASSGTSGATDPNTGIPVTTTGDVALVTASSSANRPTAAVSAGDAGGPTGVTYTAGDATQDLSLCGPEGSCVISVDGNPVPTTRTVLPGGAVEYTPTDPIDLTPGQTANTGLAFDPDEGGAGVGSATDPNTGAAADATGDAQQVTIGADADGRPTSAVTAGSAGGAFTISFTIPDSLELTLCGVFNGCRIFEDGSPLDTDRTELAGNKVRYSVDVTFTPGQVKLYQLLRFDVIAPTLNPASIFVESDGAGSANITGLTGAANDDSAPVTVEITNLQSPISSNATANPDGSFTATIAANPGDTLEIVATDSAGNASAPVHVTVFEGTGFTLNMLSELNGIGEIADVYIAGDFAIIATEHGCYIVNISNPSAPVIVSSVTVVGGVPEVGGATSVYVSGETIYLTSSYGLIIIDMSTPSSPTVVETIAAPGARGVVVREETAYVIYDGGLQVIDLGEGGGPAVVDTITTVSVGGGQPVDLSTGGGGAGSQRIFIAGDTLIIVHEKCVVRFAIGASPEILTTTHIITHEPAPTDALLIGGDTLIIGGGGGVTVIDLTTGGAGGTIIEVISGDLGGGVEIGDVTSLWGGGTLIIGSGTGGVFIIRVDISTGTPDLEIGGGHPAEGAFDISFGGDVVLESCTGCLPNGDPAVWIFGLEPDTTAPTFENPTTTPGLASGLLVPPDSLVFEVDILDDGGLSGNPAPLCPVTLSDGTVIILPMTRVPGTDNRWRAVLPLTPDMPSGPATPSFSATDPAGNVGTAPGDPGTIDNDNPEIGAPGASAPGTTGDGRPLVGSGECVEFFVPVTDATSGLARIWLTITFPDGTEREVEMVYDPVDDRYETQFCVGPSDPGGSYGVSIGAQDDAGNVSTAPCKDFHKNDKPSNPDPGDDRFADEGEEIPFDGSFNDPDSNNTHTIAWDFGDGTDETNPAPAGLSTTHVYADDGVYTVTFTVTENEDPFESVSATLEVTVLNVAPTVEAGPDQVLPEGTPVALPPATFNDKGTLDTHTSEIDWSDGTIEPGTLTESPFGPPGDVAGADGEVAGSHPFEQGNYAVNVCVTDDEGLIGCDGFLVTIENVDPIVSVEDAEIDEGETFTQTDSFEDPGADEWTAAVDYGTGDGPQALALNADKTFDLSHTYGDNGQYTVTVTVTDDDGGVGVGTLTVSVNNLDPDLALDTGGAIDFVGGRAFIGRVGTPQTHSADGSDPGSDDLTFTWNSGAVNTHFNDDANPDALPSPNGTFPFGASDSAQYDFTAPGFYSVALDVADDDGGTDSESLLKLVVDNTDCTRSQGFWKKQFRPGKRHEIDDATLLIYLSFVNHSSVVFSEQVPLNTLEDAWAVMDAGGNDRRAKATAQLLAAWLNFADGSVRWDEPIQTDDGGGKSGGGKSGGGGDDDDGSPNSIAFNELMAEAEAILLNPDASKDELRHAKDLAETVNRLHKGPCACEDEGHSGGGGSSGGGGKSCGGGGSSGGGGKSGGGSTSGGSNSSGSGGGKSGGGDDDGDGGSSGSGGGNSGGGDDDDDGGSSGGGGRKSGGGGGTSGGGGSSGDGGDSSSGGDDDG